MKGTHISRKTQRRLQGESNIDLMDIPQLTAVIDEFDTLIQRMGYDKAIQQNRYLALRASGAKFRLRKLCNKY